MRKSTLTEQVDTQPDWNDDDKLVFLRRGSEPAGDQIWVLDYAESPSDPASASVWLPTTGVVSNPTWSPDGRRIAYLVRGSAEADARLMVMDADGSDAHPVELSDPAGIPNWGSR